PLGMSSTVLARGDDSPRGALPPELKTRAAQGYGINGNPIGAPGDQTGYYHWPGTGQMYSSPRDMAVFLAANLGDAPVERSLREPLSRAHRPRPARRPPQRQGLRPEALLAERTPIGHEDG